MIIIYTSAIIEKMAINKLTGKMLQPLQIIISSVSCMELSAYKAPLSQCLNANVGVDTCSALSSIKIGSFFYSNILLKD
jgi:hypothetical protein